MLRRPPRSTRTDTLFPYTTLFRSNLAKALAREGYRPTLFGYTDQAVDPRTTAADDPRLAPYEEVLPGFEVAVKLPEDNAAWFAWLRARGHPPPDDWRGMYWPAAGQPELPNRAAPAHSQARSEGRRVGQEWGSPG